MALCHLPFGPTAYFGIHNCVLRHDIGSKQEVGTISEVHPNLIFDNFSTKLGSRFQTILKALFPVPKPSNKRIVTFSNRNDYISFRCLPLPHRCNHYCSVWKAVPNHFACTVVMAATGTLSIQRWCFAQASCIHYARRPQEPGSR